MSTYFYHKTIHEETWMSPDVLTRNQIDHGLVERVHTKAIKDIRTYRGADADTDYLFKIMKLKQGIPKMRLSSKAGKTYNLAKLQNEPVADQLGKDI